MRNIKEILRLKWLAGVSARDIAKSCGIPRSTVGDCLQRATAAKLSWPLPEEMNEPRLERLLYQQKELESGQRPLPDMSSVHQELKRKGVTLFLLWQEYKSRHSAPLISYFLI